MFLAQFGQQIDTLHGLPHHFRGCSYTDRDQSLVLAAGYCTAAGPGYFRACI